MHCNAMPPCGACDAHDVAQCMCDTCVCVCGVCNVLCSMCGNTRNPRLFQFLELPTVFEMSKTGQETN